MTILKNLLSKIVIGFVAFLLTLFPNSRGLQFLEMQRTNNSNIAATKIANAFIEKDVDALEALMCLNIKENTEDLRDKISEMVDAVEGEITEVTREDMGAYSETQEDGRQIVQVHFVLYFETATVTYRLSIEWETANNFKPEEAGIRAIVLMDEERYWSGEDDWLLADIRATEGISEWHD